MKKTLALSILTTMILGLITTFVNMYTDIVNLKAKGASRHDTLLEIKSDVKYIRNYLLEMK